MRMLVSPLGRAIRISSFSSKRSSQLRSFTAIKMIVTTEDINSIAELYKLKALEPPQIADGSSRSKLPEPSQSFNDRVGLIQGDITNLAVDAIVNAANNSLMGGGGVDGAIHRAAGRELVRECKTLDGCETGSAKITQAYQLPSKRVIHAVGPVYRSHSKERSAEKLRGCYIKSLKLAVQNRCKSIAFSALSTGVYGYPSDDAASVAIQAVKDFLEGADGDKMDKIVFCTFTSKDEMAYNKWLPQYFPPTEEDLSPDDDWEEIQAGKSAENGNGRNEGNAEADVKSTEDK